MARLSNLRVIMEKQPIFVIVGETRIRIDTITNYYLVTKKGPEVTEYIVVVRTSTHPTIPVSFYTYSEDVAKHTLLRLDACFILK